MSGPRTRDPGVELEPERAGTDPAGEPASDPAARPAADAEDGSPESIDSEAPVAGEGAGGDDAGEAAAADSEAAPPADDDGSAEASAEERGPSPARVAYDDETLATFVEALLFVSPRPLSVPQIARQLRTTFAAIRRAVARLQETYATRGVRVVDSGTGVQFRTAPECADAVRRFTNLKPIRLSKAALEALAVIAYRQPVAKPDVDEIRGVDSGSAVKLLLDRGLIRVIGRKEEPGRPLLYGTTAAFLEFFGLAGLRDLPSLRDYADLTEDGRRRLERDLFARSPEAMVVGETPWAAPPADRGSRRWEDLQEILGDDIGDLPAGVEPEAPEPPIDAGCAGEPGETRGRFDGEDAGEQEDAEAEDAGDDEFEDAEAEDAPREDEGGSEP